MRILVSGANGCIGMRLCRQLADRPRVQLLAHVRSPRRLAPDLLRRSSVEPVIGDLSGDRKWMRSLAPVDHALLTATAWSGPECAEANVAGILALMKQLAAQGCRRITYLSTASLLDSQRMLHPAELFESHDYLRTKRQLLVALDEQAWRDRVEVIYPTLIISDRDDLPLSGAARGMDWLAPHLRWLCRLRGDACVHYVHADDLAALLADWAIQGLPTGLPRPLVVGSPPVSLAGAALACQRLLGQNPRWYLPVSPRIVLLLAKLLRVRLSEWDRHCLRQPNLCHDQVVTPADFGIQTRAPDPTSYLAQWLTKRC